MIIIFFHVLYYVGKYVLNKYRTSRETKAICPKGFIFKDPYESAFEDDEDDLLDEEEEDDEDSDSIYSLDYCTGDDLNYLRFLRKHCELRTKNPDEIMEEEAAIANIRFNPPAYLQRYMAVAKVLENSMHAHKLKKIVDIGCAELQFFRYMKNLPNVEEIMLVDIDRTLLDLYHNRARPLHCDYLHRRNRPLSVKIFEGSVLDHDKNLENVDAVTCIELIEHLHPEVVDAFPASVFGFIRPKVVIITTPNADFNVLFPNMQGFRHFDHKFEWTRKEFEDWAHKVLTKYPEYDVTFEGICYGPPGTEHLGACTQMAIFHQKTAIKSNFTGTEGLFKLVESYDYPYEIDNRTDEQKILDDATYYINKLSQDEHHDYSEELPLSDLKFRLRDFSGISDELLIEILRNNNWTVEMREGGPVILIPPSSFGDYSEDHSLDNDIVNDEYPPDYDNDWGQVQGNENFVEESWSNDESEGSIGEVVVEAPSQELAEPPSINLSSFSETSAIEAETADSRVDSRLMHSCENIEVSDSPPSNYCTADSFSVLNSDSLSEPLAECLIADSSINSLRGQPKFASSPEPSELLTAKRKKKVRMEMRMNQSSASHLEEDTNRSEIENEEDSRVNVEERENSETENRENSNGTDNKDEEL